MTADALIEVVETSEFTRVDLFRLQAAISWRLAMQNTGLVDASKAAWVQTGPTTYQQNSNAHGTAAMTPKNPTYFARPRTGTTQLVARKDVKP